MTVCQT